MDILWELRPYKNYWSYGQIIDPKNGKIYSGSVWLEGDQLKLSIEFSFFTKEGFSRYESDNPKHNQLGSLVMKK